MKLMIPYSHSSDGKVVLRVKNKEKFLHFTLFSNLLNTRDYSFIGNEWRIFTPVKVVLARTKSSVSLSHGYIYLPHVDRKIRIKYAYWSRKS